MVATKPMTAAELAALAEDARYELIEGELIGMSPTGARHVVVTSDLVQALSAYVGQTRGLFVFVGEGGYVLRRNPDTVLAPDIAVVTAEQRRAIVKTGDGFVDVAPMLVVEVKSPSEREAMVAHKAALYLQGGVCEIWWVRPNERQITVYRPDRAPRTIGETDILESPELLPGFRLPLAELLAV